MLLVRDHLTNQWYNLGVSPGQTSTQLTGEGLTANENFVLSGWAFVNTLPKPRVSEQVSRLRAVDRYIAKQTWSS